MRLLVTRPEPDAARTAQELRRRGHEVIVAPLLRTEMVEAQFGGPYGAVLMTSANAARAVGRHARFDALRGLPVFAVGDRTADAARSAGFTTVESADGALPDLVRLATASFGAPALPLLYLAGEDRAGDLAGALGASNLNVETVVIYRAAVASKLPDEVTRAIAAGRLDGVMHYSPRSAVTLLKLAEQAGLLSAILGLAHFCMSEEVAAPLRSAGAMRVAVAPRPDGTALIGLT